jgi:hypothetical protein
MILSESLIFAMPSLAVRYDDLCIEMAGVKKILALSWHSTQAMDSMACRE